MHPRSDRAGSHSAHRHIAHKLLEDVECQKRSGQSGFSRVSGQKYRKCRKRFRGSYEPCSWLLRLFRVHRDEEVHRQVLVQDLWGHTCLQPRRRSVEAVALAVGQCTLLRNLHASRSPLAFCLIHVHGHGLAQHQVADQIRLGIGQLCIPRLARQECSSPGRQPVCPWR